MSNSKALDRVQVSQQLYLLAEQAREHAIILLDVNGCVSWWSGGAERLFGQPAEQAIGKEFSSIFTEDDQCKGLADLELAIAQSDAISEDDRWHLRADGSRFWASGALVPLRDSAGTLVGYGKIMRNRTNMKEQLAYLDNQLRAVTAADRNKEVGIATLVHEVRNLLAAIFYSVRLLRKEGADETRRAELVGMLEEHMQMIRRLTEDLLDVTRAQQGKILLQATELTLQETVAKSIESCQSNISEKRLQVEFLAARGAIVVHADPVRVQQIVINLLDNAIKYTPAGGKIWVKVGTEDKDAVVRVEDNGMGIPPHMLTEIFNLFTQVEDNAARSGLGIGLALVKHMVALHCGSVQARSDGLGKGSEFTVRLPLDGAAQD